MKIFLIRALCSWGGGRDPKVLSCLEGKLTVWNSDWQNWEQDMGLLTVTYDVHLVNFLQSVAMYVSELKIGLMSLNKHLKWNKIDQE